jgi:prepilin-type N-terminal cleavage/methylation domain-containing protein
VRSRRGFTLLEALVATTIMGIAVTMLLSNIATSLRTASRVTEADRAALLARRKVNELLLNPLLPKGRIVEGRFTELDGAADLQGGWRAQLLPFESLQGNTPGSPILERLEFEAWWMSGSRRRTFALEAYRQGTIPLAFGPGGLR